LLQADLAHRLDELATGGVARLFRTLHPSVAMRGDLLTIVKYYEGRAQLRERGLMLVPCAFMWPDVRVSTADPLPSLTYSPRGLGRLWESAPDARESPLAAVMGRTRATILALLELPMSTTQLAAQVELAAPTLNVHLKSLQAAGILTSRRDGRAVLYRRTPLGDQLVAAN
jgi:DNA-binding transcriptional ArsR family regulator